MIKNTISISMLGLSALCLTGCFFPYVGQGRESDLPCLSSGFFLPVVSARGQGSSCEPLDQHAETVKYRRRDADDSTKRVIYSEEQRLNLAESSARVMFPFEKHKFSLSAYLAERAITKISPRGKCRERFAQHTLALKWQERLPQNELYKKMALEWSKRYSDEQLKNINALAQKYGEDATNHQKTNWALLNVVQRQGAIDRLMRTNEAVTKTLDDLLESNKKTLMSEAEEAYASTPENDRICIYNYTDSSHLQFNIKEMPSQPGAR